MSTPTEPLIYYKWYGLCHSKRSLKVLIIVIHWKKWSQNGYPVEVEWSHFCSTYFFFSVYPTWMRLLTKIVLSIIRETIVNFQCKVFRDLIAWCCPYYKWYMNDLHVVNIHLSLSGILFRTCWNHSGGEKTFHLPLLTQISMYQNLFSVKLVYKVVKWLCEIWLLILPFCSKHRSQKPWSFLSQSHVLQANSFYVFPWFLWRFWSWPDFSPFPL